VLGAGDNSGDGRSRGPPCIGLDLKVLGGECFGLLGPNGAGKTTTIEILEGLLAADEGEVTVLGRRWATDAAALRARLGIQQRSVGGAAPRL
jgi:ABC-type multidrug transport system ATPase subunit